MLVLFVVPGASIDTVLGISGGVGGALLAKWGWGALGKRIFPGVNGNGNGNGRGALTEDRLRVLLKESRDGAVKDILTVHSAAANQQLETLKRIEETNAQVRDAVVGMKATAESTEHLLTALLTGRR